MFTLEIGTVYMPAISPSGTLTIRGPRGILAYRFWDQQKSVCLTNASSRFVSVVLNIVLLFLKFRKQHMGRSTPCLAQKAPQGSATKTRESL